MSKFFKGLKTNSKIKSHDANDDAYFIKHLLDDKVRDCLLKKSMMRVHRSCYH